MLSGLNKIKYVMVGFRLEQNKVHNDGNEDDNAVQIISATTTDFVDFDLSFVLLLYVNSSVSYIPPWPKNSESKADI